MSRTSTLRLGCIAAALTLSCVLLLGACSGNGNPTGLKQGTLRIELTDQPAELSEVNVYFAGLTVKRSGDAVRTVATDLGRIDLLTLLDTTTLLAAAAVTPGEYEFIRIELDESRSGVLEVGASVEEPLHIPSQEIKVNGPFEVHENDTTTLVLDFDAAASLRELPTGEWILEPVIVLSDVEGQ